MYRHRCENLLTFNQTFPDLTAMIYSILSKDSQNVFFYITMSIGGKVNILAFHMLNAEDMLFMMPFVVDYKNSRLSRKKWKRSLPFHEDLKFTTSARYGVEILLESCYGGFCITWGIYEWEAVINSEWIFRFLLKITLSLKLMFL